MATFNGFGARSQTFVNTGEVLLVCLLQANNQTRIITSITAGFGPSSLAGSAVFKAGKVLVVPGRVDDKEFPLIDNDPQPALVQRAIWQAAFSQGGPNHFYFGENGISLDADQDFSVVLCPPIDSTNLSSVFDEFVGSLAVTGRVVGLEDPFKNLR